MDIRDYLRNEFGKPSILRHKRTSLKYIEKINVEIDVVGHCNLNCKGCTHFSPLVKDLFLDEVIFKKDMLRLAEVMKGHIDTISLLGGEPLLHPNIISFIIISRRYFADEKIRIVTNGLLLSNMSDEFWDCCRENNIEIEVTKYPIRFNYKKIQSLSKEKRVKFSFFGRSKYVQKTLYTLPLDIKGEQDPVKSFNECFMGGNCICLENGKLYTCSYVAYINRFNEFFNQKLQVTDLDYIDIYKEISSRDIINKLNNHIPFCKYCNTSKRCYGQKWARSRKELCEWSYYI